jgi:hypothetical protein
MFYARGEVPGDMAGDSSLVTVVVVTMVKGACEAAGWFAGGGGAG